MLAKTKLLVLSTFLIGCVLLHDAESMESLKLLILGDMGGIDYEPYTTYFERSTAQEMGTLANVYAPEAIIELGDNFYYNGVKNANDPRFSETFESVYTAKSLLVPWYIIAGNHDHNGNVSAQIEYSKHSPRWNFPDYFYYREFPVGRTSHTVGIVFIDTILLCGDTTDGSPDQPKPRRHDGNKNKHWKKVEGFLKHSKANYLLVAGHFPVYSVGDHGPTMCLVDHLQPLLKKYHVNGYLCGHDHNLQHLKTDNGDGRSIDYFVSGMANFVNPARKHMQSVPKNSLRFHNADYATKGGFLFAEATVSNMTFSFISANGNNLYSTVVPPRFRFIL